MKIGIVGYGFVGKAMAGLFPDAAVHDAPLGLGSRADINACDLAFVCVPTPPAPDGGCDTGLVREVVEWLETPVIALRSTVTVGFTDEMIRRTGKRIVFHPEYLGETVDHPLARPSERAWLAFGGGPEDVDVVVRAYQSVYNANVRIHVTDAKTAELAKYMENAFFALKVVFCNEFYDLARALGVDYHQLRELWLADPRVERSHSFVYPDQRGFGGKCLPKDVDAVLEQARALGVELAVLRAAREKNRVYREGNGETPKPEKDG